ncbi:hypothetical protein Lesp02_38030 [Lentzea sp. NBRC 105346]|uniref:FAD-dependent oxidoreductase n=1 Tax=Lentzea sp. NBRC 105346 TaxID=3032205 RepID=UPI0024A19473|nr:FAD-dependent oxidoreductase [Lentzea sp. NBRC 105346]GLZ31615.1 hypothetical protein Lesp02_38030 [Lentzea sp. NBRC 105346]
MTDMGIGRRSFLAGAGPAAAVPGTALAAAPARDEARRQTCLGLAKDLLPVGPKGEDLKLEYLRILTDDGLPKAPEPKKVVIVGAGTTGLVTGLLPKQAGHHVTITEANEPFRDQIPTRRPGRCWWTS